MTTATLSTGTLGTVMRPRRSLEELVDRLMAALFPEETEEATPTMARGIHEARRLRQAGDIDKALGVFAGMATGGADPAQARWAHAEWLALVKRRHRGRELLLYGPSTGRAAALTPTGDGATLEVVAVLGMRWRPGKLVSRTSLRGLRSLGGG